MAERVRLEVVASEEALVAVRRAFEEFRAVPFPGGSSDAVADELHAELAEYSGWVAGLVTTLVGGGAPRQRFLFHGDLETRLQRLVEEGDTEASADARRYLDYLRRVHKLVEQARPLQRPVREDEKRLREGGGGTHRRGRA